MSPKKKYYIKVGVLLTPKLAKKLLGKARHNRDVSKTKVRKYANEIKNGKWKYPTGELIKIGANGGLGDGQHRCLAVIYANKAVMVDIAYYVPEDNFRAIDQQKPRSGADTLNMEHQRRTGDRLKYNKQIASALQIVYAWLETKNVYNTRHSINMLSNDSLQDYFDKHEKIVKSAMMVCGKNANASPSVLTALHYILSNQHGNKAIADSFFHALATGENLQKGSPVLILRNKFYKFKGDGKYRMTRQFVISCVLYAWHAYAQGKAITNVIYNIEHLPQPIRKAA